MFILELILGLSLILPPQTCDATIGVSAIDLESGRRFSLRERERFPMRSVYKSPIGLATLRLVDNGALALDERVSIRPEEFSPGWSPIRDGAKGKMVTLTIEELLRAMVEVSDNTASDVLLRRVGGPAAVTRRMRELGIEGIRVDRPEREIAADLSRSGGVKRYGVDPRDTATPEAMAKLLEIFWKGREGLSAANHARLVKWMTDTKTGMRRIRAGVQKGTVVIHKTGTMPGTTNDAGIIISPDGNHHVILAVFTKQAKTSKAEQCEDDIAEIARAVHAELAR